MAGVKSLAIRGIRSFGPEDDDEQRLSFEKPLTLILGQNGCGKTTIIECLRYAVTGQMPPGSRNECFVHDAKVNRSSEVVGQVKLKIINAKNEQLEVSRTMKVTALQKKKTKFQTLDSFLSTIDDNGKTKDISSRCADLDSVMYEQLGVSKAILNSVIFCHQEDSSWPLDEGKKVKERFDEIFDADKYSDCFDRLRKIRKDYTTAIKLLEQEVSFLAEKKQELDKKKLDVVDTESKISEAEIKIAEITQELKPVTEKIKAIQTLQKNLVSFESKREKIKTKLEHNQTLEQDMKKAIKDIFEGTTEELQEKINTYETTVKAKEKELAESHKSNFAFNKEEEKIANERTANEVTYNKLIMLESQNQEKMDKRNKMIVETAKLAEMEMDEINMNEEAEKGINEITNKLKSLNDELDKLKSEADSEENEYQSHIDTSRDAFTSHKQKISSKEIEIRNVKREITKLEKAINDATESKHKLDLLDKKINDAEEEYKQLENDLNPEEFQKEINDDEKVVDEHEQELEQLGEKITKLQKQSAKLKEREMIEDILRQKERQYNMLFNKHKTTMIELLGSVPEKDFALSVNKHECSLRTEVDSMKQKLKEKHIELSGLEAERKHVRSSLNARRAELTAAEDQMYRACGTQPYDATLAKITATVDKLQDEQNVLQSSMFIIAKYKTQLKDNNCCPVCNRGFESETDVTNLISEMTTQVMNVPTKLEKVTEELQRSSAKKDELLSMKSLNDKITTLKEKEIPQLETRLSEIDKKISTLNESVEELTTSLIEPEQKLQTAKQLLTDMPLLDRFIQEIKTTNDTLDSVKAQCSDLETDMNLDDAQAKQADLKQKISTLRARIKSSNTKLNAHNKKLHKMADARNKLKEQRLKIQEKVQQMCNLQENLKQLEANREQYNTELIELQESKGKFEDELKEKENAKNEVVKKNRAAIDVKRNYITKIVNAFDKVKYIVSEIKQHEQRNIQREMDNIKKANEKLMEKQKQIMIDRDTLTKKIDTLKEEVLKQGIIKRDLDDNLKLRKAQTEITNCEKELEQVNAEINGIDTAVISELESLISKQTQLFRQKAQTEGQLRELQDRLKQCQQELKKHLNKNIEIKFREKNYELHITKGIDKDIRDYSVTLEKCLMEFHKEKMENINLIIREMWRKIYRGNDIDYIEIKTEGSMTVDSERRKYDYRVVQCKNGVEIDMRGRCSAGQKVLACLIIRLALAETFSSRFGILALDEPTTNLDQENIHSLCAALGEIVQERMKQKNFMFIIITHDKEFIENLGNIDKVTHYYEVSRNDDGKSRVKKIKFT